MCPYCAAPTASIIRKGRNTVRLATGTRPQRFLCKVCRQRFSERTSSPTYRQRKPRMDLAVARLLAAGMSQRTTAESLGVHQITVARKLIRVAEYAKRFEHRELAKRPVGPIVVFDEMETFEHSKCKPLSIAVAVEEGSRRIISVEVASMPAKGRLAKISHKKYGFRPDHRSLALAEMCRKIKAASPHLKTVKSDLCPRYPAIVRLHLPKVEHIGFKGRRGCVVGQGELKAGGFDPLFSLNHTCAMNRDRLKRLSRRTWCTTKRPDRLQAFLRLYAWVHNHRLEGGTLRTLRLKPVGPGV